MAFRCAEIDDDGLLVSRLDHGPQGAFLGDHAPVPERIASGWLDLDDPCTHVGEQAGGEGAGDERAELQHAQTTQLPCWLPHGA